MSTNSTDVFEDDVIYEDNNNKHSSGNTEQKLSQSSSDNEINRFYDREHIFNSTSISLKNPKP